MDIDKLLEEIQDRIEYYTKSASDIIESAKSIHATRDDPYEAHKVLIEGQKVQELAAEYLKLAAQLHCVLLAHKVADKAGFRS